MVRPVALGKGKELPRELARMDRRIRDLERTMRLKNSGFHGSIPIYDRDGLLRLLIGLQADGTYALTESGGLKPPLPARPVLTALPAAASVTWSGLTAIAAGEEAPPPEPDAPAPGEETVEEDYPDYITDVDYTTDDAPDPEAPVDPDAEFADTFGRWPRDMARVEIHMSADPVAAGDFECTDDTQVGAFLVFGRTQKQTIGDLEPETLYWFRLQGATKSGREGRATTAVTVTTLKDALAQANQGIQDAYDAQEYAKSKNRVFRQPTAPVLDPADPFAIGDVWFDTDDANHMYVWDYAEDGITLGWQDAQDGGIVQAQARADEAYDEAVAAMDAAEQAGATTNKVIYSVDPPGATPNDGGELWFQKDPASHNITHQFIGQGGTTWAEVQIRNEVIANLDAGKLTAGSAFIVNLFVKNLLTLGTADSNGIIASHNFSTSAEGVFIDKLGLVAKGGTISGATVQSTSDNVSGVKMTGSGLRAYDSNGTQTFWVDAATGNVYLTGSVAAGVDLSGVVITGSTFQTSYAEEGIKMSNTGMSLLNSAGDPMMVFDASTGSIAMMGNLMSGSTIAGATITGGVFRTSAATGDPRMVLASGIYKNRIGFYTGATYEASPDTGTPYEAGGVGYGPSGVVGEARGSSGFMLIDLLGPRHEDHPNKVAIIRANANASGRAEAVLMGTHIVLGEAGVVTPVEVHGTVSVGEWVQADDLFTRNEAPTSGDVPAAIGPGGKVKQDTSSARYKDNIIPLDLDPDVVYAMEPVTFTRTEYGANAPVQAGFTAEQLHALGMTPWVFYDNQGRPDGIHYPALTAALVHVAKSQNERLLALENAA